MKFIIDSSLLNKALKVASPAIRKTVVIPILSSVKIEVNKTEMTLTSTSFNLTIIQKIACESKDQFSFVVEFDKLNNISSIIGAQPVTIELSKHIELSALSGEKYKIGILHEVKDFPSVEDLSDANFEYDVDEEFLYQLQLATNCVSKDELKPQFEGVCVEQTKEFIRIFSTDTYQCYAYTIPLKSNVQIRVPIDAEFIRASKVFKDGKLQTSDKFVKLSNDKTTIISRLSEHKYPDCSMFFSPYEFNLKANNKDLAGAISKMMVYNSDLYTAVFNFSKKDSAKIDFDDYLNDNHFNTEIKAEHNVDVEEVRFNASILKNLFSLVPESEEINISIKDEKKLVRMNPDNKNVTLMIAPIYIPEQQNS